LKKAQLGGELILHDGRPFDLSDGESVTQLTSAVRGV